MQQAAAPPANQDAAAAAGDAPPKQVAQALEQLGQAGRLIADVRLGADRLLEALFYVAEEPHHQHSAKCLNLILKEESLMRQHLQNLSAIGRQLEESGVLNDSLRSRSNSWGLHMPLVCPDGAVVAYAWKRQLAGQAGASAVDRTRHHLCPLLQMKAPQSHQKSIAFQAQANGYKAQAVVSLHTAGSMDPDAVAFFSPDEEHASMALQYFTCANPETALHSLLVFSAY
ncbi:UNVERIFIED_CONTAM: Mediator of RNA polymerase II transcription subunit [Sesamum radiatum]|uniref:Mediator of RNA polymerase II transcription subunit n=1 Tax=Sesamum radiatum TaxID=300843 RepID=A0AAW2TXT2_SESRA